MTYTEKKFLKQISDRAKERFNGNVKEDWDEWVEHWFDQADLLRLELVDEELWNSVDTLDKIVEDQRKFTERNAA